MTDSTNRPTRLLKALGAPLLLFAVAACATPFQADVSRFQNQVPAPSGQTFAVVAEDPKLAGGLEFGIYADLVEAELEEFGYTQGNPETATLLVQFDYGVDNGRERVRTRSGANDPFFDPWFSRRGFFGRRGGWGFGFHDPWLGGPEVRSYTVYTSGIDLKINNTVTDERVFEGKAQAISKSNRLQHLVPNLVDALFTDFPGNSGEDLRITIKPEEGEKIVRSRVD